ncbi:response regulator transcription factor [Geovibrio thiophilus]|uniref:Response regulator transcription factor n=1 Tax=Geovibrio thiophilus TaxID=139438 RepID=A0A3R5X3H5_9BACT|nr:response regulator transcription factor [Geovibrio thiophilus]QAR33668.1 response regulator transcription factor [Geovibrio thiophilus]
MNFINANILIIDDDTELCELLETYLGEEGFGVESVHEGKSGLAKAQDGGFSLIILDVMLPGMDGFAILRELRKTNDTPVFMLTARGEETDRISGIENGADDYLPKPFNPRELIVRIKAILRRTGRQTAGVTIEAGTLRINTLRLSAYAGGQEITLTSAEFQILEMLMRSAGKTVSRDDISKCVFERELNSFDRSIDVHISNIRKKIGDPDIIKSIRGAGYILTAEVKN